MKTRYTIPCRHACDNADIPDGEERMCMHCAHWQRQSRIIGICKLTKEKDHALVTSATSELSR